MNIAFIDAQNLHLGTTKCISCGINKHLEFKDLDISDCICGTAWKVDFFKFRKYLLEKLFVQEAYYFLGFLNEDNQSLYSDLQKAGFIIVFREHNKKMLGTKKGNVDTDIVFEIMRNLIENSELEKIVLVSGDGDYKKTVDYLIKKNKLEKILFPNGKTASSLYNNINNSLKLSFSRKNVRELIEYKK